MKKNVIFLTNLRYDGYSNEPSVNTIKYWCEKHDYIFFHEPDNSSNPWENLFNVFNVLNEKNIEYDKIFILDSLSMVKWDCPDIFKQITDDRITAWREMGNLGLINNNIQECKSYFPNININIFKYVNYGSLIVNKKHEKFFDYIKEYYYANKEKINKLNNNISFQTILNYLLQSKNIRTNTDISREFNLNHMMRYDWFSHNWQDGVDKTNFFIKYAYLWRFDDLDNTKYTDISSQMWNSIKNQYTI